MRRRGGEGRELEERKAGKRRSVYKINEKTCNESKISTPHIECSLTLLKSSHKIYSDFKTYIT